MAECKDPNDSETPENLVEGLASLCTISRERNPKELRKTEDESRIVTDEDKTIHGLVPYNDVIIWSEDLTDPNIGCDDVLLYCKGPCGWNSEQLSNYKKERSYSLHFDGHISDVKAAYYAHEDNMYFYLRSTCSSQTRSKNYDVWVLFNKNTGNIMVGGCTCKAPEGVKNRTCNHCVAFLFYLSEFVGKRRTEGRDMQWVSEKPEEKSSHQPTSAAVKSCNPTVPVQGPRANDEQDNNTAKPTCSESPVKLFSEAVPIAKLLLSNVMGDNPAGSADKRKKAIVAMLKQIKPTVVLVQEFPWVGIQKKTWKEFDFPEYKYVGNKDIANKDTRTCILYQYNVDFNVINEIEIRNFIKEMQKRWTQRHVSQFLAESMCVGVVNVPKAHFLCVSWHGQSNSLNENDRKDNLKNFLECINEIANILKVPYIIGGDFNLSLEKVRDEIPKQLQQIVKICHKKPQPMRTADLIDFFIASNTLTVGEITAIKWEKVDGASVENIFTHDPIVATLTSAPEPPANVQ